LYCGLRFGSTHFNGAQVHEKGGLAPMRDAASLLILRR